MKRGRISSVTDPNSKRGRKEITQYSGSSFADLPKDILINILLRLPVKWICVFKCVCKTWYDVVCDPEYGKLQFDQSEVYPLIRRSGSSMVYLLQPDKDDFELKLGMSCDHCFFKPQCVCSVEVKIDSKFKIPERNECVKPNMKNKNYKYSVVNSCNGLLCLVTTSRNDPPIVCNPITGEFINLSVPKAKKQSDRDIYFGFGFSPETNQYKVIRMFKSVSIPGANMAEVHILGTRTWKNIGPFNQSMCKLSPEYLNGFLYWPSGRRRLSVVSFDIRRECFELVSEPTTDEHCLSNSVGVLGGELCIYGVLKSGASHVWTMKDYGTEKAWSKVFSFNFDYFQIQHYGSLKPIKYLNGGALLMFASYANALIYIDPKNNRMRSLHVHGIEPKVEAIAHIPSFVSLKHALSRQNVNVFNVSSRCPELKLHGEAKYIDLVEEEFYRSYDSDREFDYDDDEEFYLIPDSDFDSDNDSDFDFDYDFDYNFESDSDFDFDFDSDYNNDSEYDYEV